MAVYKVCMCVCNPSVASNDTPFWVGPPPQNGVAAWTKAVGLINPPPARPWSALMWNIAFVNFHRMTGVQDMDPSGGSIWGGGGVLLGA